MRVLITLTYYRPHYSGLTIYTERLACALAALGDTVTVLTSRFHPSLKADETTYGIHIIRLNVLARISKGVIMPSIPWHAWRLIQRADVVNLHVPQLDAAPTALLARLMGRPVVLTYHCDLQLPRGLIHWLANQVSHLANHMSARMANVVVTNTRDYAENSLFLRKYIQKVRVIPPPVELAPITDADVSRFREKNHITDEQMIIGMAARLATEKGVEYLVEALPGVLQRYSNARVLFVGQYQNVLGEERYAAKLAPLIDQLGAHWSFLGVIPLEELAAFYHVCSVLVLPSINNTESFGMVQVEAMMCGTPVVATDIPGVRQPVLSTGMGRIVPPRDAQALKTAIIDVLDHPEAFCSDGSDIHKQFDPEMIARQYQALFQELARKV